MRDRIDQIATGDHRAQIMPEPIIDDRRSCYSAPAGYVVCTDTFLSGWGDAPGRSLYALAFSDAAEADALLIAARGRTDMQRPRIVSRVKANGEPRIRLQPGDHLAIVDGATAAEWYRGAAARWNCSE